jgi:cell wall-associated NlpC family hydrolase
MSYTKQEFVDNKTTLKAEHLQNIENGILANETAIKNKQDLLKSGVNIKTINGSSILGAGNIDLTNSSGGGISASYLVESSDLFNIYKGIDFFLKPGTLSDGTTTVFAKYSNTNNARNVVLNMEAGATYDISVTNIDESTTYRMVVATFEESFDEIKLVGLNDSVDSVDINATPVSVPAEILYSAEKQTTEAGSFTTTYTNEHGYKTMIIFCGWGTTINPTGSITVKNPLVSGSPVNLKGNIKITEDNLSNVDINYEPWGGYLDPNVYKPQDVINLTNALRANMTTHNLATTRIMEIAYNFWKRRNEFIYCSYTALDKPWDYWSYVGFVDGANTGFTVGEGHGGYKRIDCSTFVRYVVNGIDYYSTPYYNALEWTEVTQGALTNGIETDSSDVTVCRTGKMYVRLGKKHIVESANSSSYKFNGIYAYDRSNKMVQDLTGKTSFTLSGNVAYIRAEMKVSSASNYAPAVKGKSPAAILKCLRIREDERLAVNAEIPTARNAFQMCQWCDNNGYGLEAFDDYNPLKWEDADFKPGTIVYMGRTTSSNYKGITHITIYAGGGYIIHAQAPRGLLGGEGIMMDQLRDMEHRYDRPFCAAASPKYHTDYSEEKSLLGITS